MLEPILELGSDIAQEGLIGMTPLSLALVKNKFECVKFLLIKGADHRKYTTGGAPLVQSLQEKGRNDIDIKCTEFSLNFIQKERQEMVCWTI